MRSFRVCALFVALSIVASTASVSYGPMAASAGNGCPAGLPLALVLQPGGASAAGVVACTNSQNSAVWFHNRGDVVWRINTNPGGVSVVQHTNTPNAVARRSAVASVYKHAVLGPNTRLTVRTYPSAVTIWPDDDLSALWWTHELLSDIVDDALEDGVILLASQRSKVAGTLATCAIAANSGLEDLGSLKNDDDRTQRFLSAIGLTSSVGACATSWAKLRSEVDDLPTWRRGVIALSDEAGFLAKVDTYLERLYKFIKIAPNV